MLAQTRIRRIYKSLATLLVDFAALLAGAGLVYIARFEWFKEYFQGTKLITGQLYLEYATMFSLITLFIFAISGMYETKRQRSILKQIITIVGSVSFVGLGIIAYLFFNEFNAETTKINKSVLAFIIPTVITTVLVGRIAIYFTIRLIYKLGFSKINVATVGFVSQNLQNYLKDRLDINKIYTYKNLSDFNFHKIEKLLENRKAAEIYLEKQGSPLEAKIAHLCERYKINFIYNPNSLENYSSFDLQVVPIKKEIYLELVHAKLDGWGLIVKRVFDILVSLIISILLSPILIIIAIMIKLEDGGPIFYQSDRTGPDGKPFKLWKFRRMKVDLCTSEDHQNNEAMKYEQELIKQNDMRKDGVLYKIKDDPRNTKIGKFIEKYSIDELPQIINVLQGNMSLVGPRPHQPREVSKYKEHHYKVLNIKPGITGMAQISGRSDLKFDDEVKYDVHYLQNWSIFLDIWIIIMTPITIIFKKHKS